MSAVAYNDNQQLAFTQELRRSLVSQFMIDGKFPEDPKMVTLLLNALRDYDKVTLTLKRLDADSENSSADRQALEQFHRLSGMLGAKDVSRVEKPDGDPNQQGPATPFDATEIPVVELVEGELARGVDAVNYDTFMDEQTRRHQESLNK